MNAFLQDFMQKINFPKEAQAYFLRLYDHLWTSQRNMFVEMEEVYMDASVDNDCAYNFVTSKVARITEGKNVHFNSVYMLFCLCCARRLQAAYAKAGLPEDMFYDLMHDLKYKLDECQKYFHIWGTMTFSWFRRHYLLDRFALGRFQYETAEFKMDEYRFGDYVLHKGDAVYNFHIPSSGPITEEARMDSYRRAHRFFGKKQGEIIPLVCHSWLLFPDHRYVYAPNSNLAGFLSDFDIIAWEEQNTFPNAWRLFYQDYDGDPDKLPTDTTLQRNFVAWLKKGGTTGNGYGVILFDGERIVNKK